MSNSPIHPLHFRPDGSFNILQFTDLHYRNGEPEDQHTTALMTRLLDEHPPDLVVLTGDIIDGSFCIDPSRSMQNALQPVVDRNIPFAAVFGNHDDEGAATRAQLMDALGRIPNCRAFAGPADISGIGNYTLSITHNQAAVAKLYFLDSGAYAGADRKQYAWIKQDQIDWYLEQSRDSKLPALMFFHIPLPEYDTVWNMANCTGAKNEIVCCPKFNSGLFAALKSAGDVKGVFVGHDHVNDYSGDLDGIQLCYGRCTGFSSYGRAGFARGARMIRLRAGENSFTTWTL